MSVQNAALVSFADVSIDKIEPIAGGRRLLADSIKVTTSVKPANKHDADKLQSELLTAANINYELGLFGLPAAKIIEAPAIYKVTITRFDWTIGFSGAEEHQKLSVFDGDMVEFLWKGTHNVYQMKDKTAFDACDFVGSTPVGNTFGTSGVREVISSGDGTIHYFACKVGSDCSGGQKLAITIVSTGDQDMREANVDTDQPSAPPMKDSDKVSAGTRPRHFLSLSLIGLSVGLTMASPSKTSLSLSILVVSAWLFYSSSAHVAPAKIDCRVTWSSKWSKCSIDANQMRRYIVDQCPTRAGVSTPKVKVPPSREVLLYR